MNRQTWYFPLFASYGNIINWIAYDYELVHVHHKHMWMMAFSVKWCCFYENIVLRHKIDAIRKINAIVFIILSAIQQTKFHLSNCIIIHVTLFGNEIDPSVDPQC